MTLRPPEGYMDRSANMQGHRGSGNQVLHMFSPSNWYMKLSDKEFQRRISELNSEQLLYIMNNTNSRQSPCLIRQLTESATHETGCHIEWDGLFCWPMVAANATVHLTCPTAPARVQLEDSFGLTTEYEEPPVVRAIRSCNGSGKWNQIYWQNWSICQDTFIDKRNLGAELYHAMVLRDIYFVGSILSLILLCIALFIFSYFKALNCNRISIHKNLVLSFLLRSVLLIIMLEPSVTGRVYSYRDLDWLCKAFHALLQYAMVASVFWMFVEGLYLHNRVAISVFSTETPFIVFYVVGWGIPGVIVIAWVSCLSYYNKNRCWRESFNSSLIWLVLGPIIVALAVNTVFLVNIIRILITKLRASNTLETDQIRKAVKATAVLFPLLGLTNLLFLIEPMHGTAVLAYRVTNALLQSFQGIFVTIIYCFLNAEVRSAIRKKWTRYRATRLRTSRSRRRASRTSSFFLTTEVSVIVGVKSKGLKFTALTSRKCRKSSKTTAEETPTEMVVITQNGDHEHLGVPSC